MTYSSLQEATSVMIQDAGTFYRHGWLMGTSGNLSMRLDCDHFLITASGKDKGALTEEDFLRCNLQGTAIDETELKPSAETLIHCAIYEHFPDVRAIYHTHDPFAALCSARDNKRGLDHTSIQDVEMNKGLGQWTQGGTIQIPILSNHANLKTVAQETTEFLDAKTKHDVWMAPCINLLKHGVYAWGDSAFAAKRHMESTAYLFHYSWQWSLSGL